MPTVAVTNYHNIAGLKKKKRQKIKTLKVAHRKGFHWSEIKVIGGLHSSKRS